MTQQEEYVLKTKEAIEEAERCLRNYNYPGARLWLDISSQWITVGTKTVSVPRPVEW